MANDTIVGISNISGLLASVENFTGESNGIKVDDFIESIEDISILGDWEDKDKLTVARLRMKGAAKEWLRANPEIKSLKIWRPFKEALQREFHKVTAPAQVAQNFSNCMQREGESVREFETRLKLAAMATLRTSEDAAKNKIRMEMLQEYMYAQFCAGVSKKYQRYVLSSTANTLSEAVAIAIREENNDKLVNLQTNSIYAIHHEDHTQSQRSQRNFQQRSNTYRGRGNDRFQHHQQRTISTFNSATTPPINNNRWQRHNYVRNNNFNAQNNGNRATFTNQNQRIISCYKCGIRGHVAKFCPNRNNQKCFNCGAADHFARNCPSGNGQRPTVQPQTVATINDEEM